MNSLACLLSCQYRNVSPGWSSSLRMIRYSTLSFSCRDPSKNAFNAAWVGRHHADAGELYALGGQFGVNVIEPLISDSAAPSAHVGKDEIVAHVGSARSISLSRPLRV